MEGGNVGVLALWVVVSCLFFVSVFPTLTAWGRVVKMGLYVEKDLIEGSIRSPESDACRG